MFNKISTVTLFLFLLSLPVYSKDCFLCPNETELLPSIKSKYGFKFTGKGANVLNKRFRGLSLILFKDLDSKNAIKYDVVNRKGLNYFGDGHGIVDHEVIHFNLPLEEYTFNCVGDINPQSSKLKGVCTSTASINNKLSLVYQPFQATPLNKLPITEGQPVRDCLSMSCAEVKSSLPLLMSNYNFSATLVEGRIENYRISFSILPNNKPGAATILKYDVYDLDSSNLLFGGGAGFLAYRKLYFDLPILIVLRNGINRFINFGCVGTINPSDYSIDGSCSTIELNSADQLETVGGSFSATAQ